MNLKLKDAFIDFETESAACMPARAPAPVGYSYRLPGMRKTKYMAFGHPEGTNNCTYAEARELFTKIWNDKTLRIIAMNAKFDFRVAQEAFGLPPLPWERTGDLMFLLFLDAPYSMTLALKPAGERLLGIPPEESDAVHDWLRDHGIIRNRQKDWKAYICKAPGVGVVDKYCCQDTDLLMDLYRLLYKPVCTDRNMIGAYERELKLLPILMRNEQEGIRLAVAELERDLPVFKRSIETADAWLRKRLGAPGLNIDSDAQLATALDTAGIVTEWKYTEKGNRITRKDTMTVDLFTDPRVASVLGYRNRLSTCVGTFAESWLTTALEYGGRVYTDWNQVRGSDGGARTGRLSSSPNFQNVPTDWLTKNDGYVHPAFLKSLAPLPYLRRYFLPDDDNSVWCSRDYSSQELRVLAHFEDGPLLEQYRENVRLDVHQYVRDSLLNDFGKDVPRGPVKILNFLMVYGGGLDAVIKKTKFSPTEAKQLKDMHKRVLPGVTQLNADVRAIVKSGDPIRTWGGREYFVEPPKLIKGRMMDFTYKLPNYLIQGSSAEMTKQALINYDAVRKEGRFLVTVHDQTDISVNKKALKREALILREAMLDVDFDVPMITDCEVGPNWHDIEKMAEPKYGFEK